MTQSSSIEDPEWVQLSGLLGAKPTDEAALAAARVGMMRLNQRLSLSGVRTFGWKEVPTELGLGYKTAHRRVSQWMKSGKWWLFWDSLMSLRAGPYVPAVRTDLRGLDPVSSLLSELHRAYHFFNWRFTGNMLPSSIAITLERPQHQRRHFSGYMSIKDLPTPSGRQAHIALLPERLGNMHATLECLLHEMAHLRNYQLGMEDTDGRTQYHTMDFKVSAELFGLTCLARDKARGYQRTQLGTRALDAIGVLVPDREHFDFTTQPRQA